MFILLIFKVFGNTFAICDTSSTTSCVTFIVAFDDIGYHYLLDDKGIVYEARDINLIASAVYQSETLLLLAILISHFAALM